MRQQYTEYRTGTADHRPSLHLLPSDIEKFDLTTSFFSNLLGVMVRKELAKIKPPVTMDERNAIAKESIALAPSPIIKHGAPGEKDTCVTDWKD